MESCVFDGLAFKPAIGFWAVVFWSAGFSPRLFLRYLNLAARKGKTNIFCYCMLRKNKTVTLYGSLIEICCDLEIIVLEQLRPVALCARFTVALFEFCSAIILK
jgi:hypothetical protein